MFDMQGLGTSVSKNYRGNKARSGPTTSDYMLEVNNVSILDRYRFPEMTAGERGNG